MKAFRANSVVLRVKSYRGHVLIALVLLLVAGEIVTEVTDDFELMVIAGPFVAAVALALLFSAAFLPEGFLTRETRGTIVTKREGVFFAGRCIVPRDSIRNVSVEELIDGTAIVHVTATRSQKNLRLVLPTSDDNHRFFEALELDPEQRVATFSVHDDPLRSRRRRFAMRALVVLAPLAACGLVALIARKNDYYLLLMPPLLVAYAHVLPRLRRWTDVALGADGITLRHRGRVRSIALSAIDEQRRADNVVHVALQDGEIVPLHFGAVDNEKATAQRTAFVTGLQHALAHRGDAHDASEALLARGGRDIATWRIGVAALANEATGFRVTAAVPPETLWRIAENVAADPSARAGAIAALQSRGLEPERLRALAERTAQRELRAALEAAAEGASAEEVLEAYDRHARS